MRAVLLLALFAGLTPARQAEDPIAKKLAESAMKFDVEKKAYRDGVFEWLDKQVAAARKGGNKKLVDQLLADREAFDKTDAQPANAPKVVVTAYDAARKAREAAMQAAVKEYTMANRDPDAKRVEELLREFRYAGTPIGRWAGKSPVKLTNRNSGKVASVASNAKNDGTGIIQWPWHDGAGQQWVLTPAEGDYFVLRSELSKTLLTKPVKDAKVVVIDRPAADAAHQQWKFTPVSGEKNTYLIQNRAGGLYLGVVGGSTDHPAGLALDKLSGAAGAAHQHWKLEKLGD